MKDMGMFWWVFALRGGFALLFAGILYGSGNLLGTIFFDPVMLVFLSLLLGSYVLGNGLLLGVAGGFAIEHHLRHLRLWWLLLGECGFAVLLAGYIGFSLLITAQSLALLAGLHALGTGCFQGALALKLPHDRPYVLLLSASGVISLFVGIVFLMHHDEALRTITQWLSGFELFYGVVVITFARGLHKHGSANIPQPARVSP